MKPINILHTMNYPFNRATKRLFILCIVLCFMMNAYPQSNGLPVISIETQDRVVIDSRDIWTDMTSFVLTDPNHPENNISRTNISPELDRIRGRGNSTWWSPKKPYRIRFRENISFFGLHAAENWVLLANYLDPTLINNSFAFELGARLNVPYTPSYNHVDVYLNGVYQGNYMFTEHRQAAPKGVVPGPGRVGIDLTEGWLTEMDFHWAEEHEDPKFRTRHYNMPLLIKSPELGSDADHPVYNTVKNDWNNLCDLMFASAFPENGYRDLIDMESIIDFFLVNIITHNTDFYIGLDGRQEPGSIFFHKDKGGKIFAGPLWDFDLSFRYGVGGPTANSRAYPTYPFLSRFMQDPVFCLKWKESWNNNYPEILSMLQFIDALAAKIRKSVEEDYKKWRPEQPISEFDRRIRMMKEYLNERLVYLNSVYQSIDVFPTSANFGTMTYSKDSDVPFQKLTLVAYGETNMTASFRNNNSAFEFYGIEQTATGKGGYWASINVKPKTTIATAIYSDVLILRGTNRGKNFAIEIPLWISIKNDTGTATVSSELSDAPDPLRVWINNNNLRITGLTVGETLSIYNAAGRLIYRCNATGNEITLPLSVQGLYIVTAGDRTVKVILN